MPFELAVALLGLALSLGPAGAPGQGDEPAPRGEGEGEGESESEAPVEGAQERLPATAAPRSRTGRRARLELPPRPWPRGRGWAAARLTVGGPIGGQAPAAASVAAVSGGVELGWRIHNMIGLGLGVYRQPHSATVAELGAGGREFVDRGHLTSYDLLLVRAYVPIRFALQPYIDVGGGLATIEPSATSESVRAGGQARAGLGADAWLTPQMTLGFGMLYRVVYAGRSLGQGFQGYFEVGFHW